MATNRRRERPKGDLATTGRVPGGTTSCGRQGSEGSSKECTSQFVVGMAFWFGIDLLFTVSSCEGEMFFEARALPSLRLDPPGGRVFLLPSNFCRHQMPKRRVILWCRTCVVIRARGDRNFAAFDLSTLPLAGG